MWLLKSYSQPIPNNYFYTQTDGIQHTFAPQPFIEEVAKSVSSFRIANKLPRASLVESLEDIDKYQCAVRGNDPKYCYEANSSFEDARASHHFIKKGCPTCGVAVKPN